MTIEDVREMLRAGFTADEIRAFNSGDVAPANDSAPEAATDPPAAEEPAAPAPAPEASPDPAPAWAAALQKSIEDLTRATQNANALFDDMGGEADRASKAEAALGQYITGKKAGKK